MALISPVASNILSLFVFDKYKEIYEMLEKKEDPDCGALLGHCHILGYGTRIDLNKAKRLLNEGVERGSKLAEVLLTFLTRSSNENIISALTEMTNVPGRGELKSIVAFAYIHGVMGAEKNEEMGYKLAEEATKEGSCYGLTRLGYCLERGIGIEKDPQKGAECYLGAAKRGLAVAQYNMAILFSRGIGVPKSEGKAIKFFTQASNQGYVFGLYNLANLYLRGVIDLLPKDEMKAIRLFRYAADQGHASSHFRLGVCYYSGVGIEKNRDLSMKHFLLAAENGDVNAMYNVGLFFELGMGVEKNLEEAGRWFIAAAESGSSSALEKLKV